VPHAQGAAGLLCVVPVVAGEQENPPPSPEEWRKLPLAEFVSQIDRLTSGTDPVSEQLWTEIRSQSAERLLSAIGAGTQADYRDLVSLYMWGSPNLTVQQRDTVLASLKPPADQVSAWTFDKMRSAHERMERGSMPQATRDELVVAWLKDRDVGSFSSLSETGWLFEQVHQIKRDQVSVPTFSVRWTGFVQAPTDGAYTFSICPINLDFQHLGEFRRQTTVVWIADRQALDSSKNGWTFKAEPVSLKGNEKAPIRVELSYTCSGKDISDDRPAIAILMWEGPGMNTRVVPGSALSLPEGGGTGLQAEYRLVENGQQKTAARVDPNIDQIWHRGCYLVPSHPELHSRLADRLWVLATDPNVLAEWEKTGAARDSNWLGGAWWFLESLPSSRHKTLLAELLARPGLLESASQSRASEFYRYCRVGAPDQALEFFGAWARMHPDAPPEFGPEFYKGNRALFREASARMVWEYRPHLDALETRYLELPDGRCCLPVAYTLSYGHWAEGRIGEWIGKLKARLDDEKLSGDRRVNWLLARAQAQEIRDSRPDRYCLTFDRTLAGLGWLQEACLVAQAEAVRLRAYKELAVRQAARSRIEAARSTLNAAAKRCTAPELAETLAAWRQELEQLAGWFEKLQQDLAAAARQHHIDILRGRLRRARDRDDQAAAARYEQLLTDAGAKID